MRAVDTLNTDCESQRSANCTQLGVALVTLVTSAVSAVTVFQSTGVDRYIR